MLSSISSYFTSFLYDDEVAEDEEPEIKNSDEVNVRQLILPYCDKQTLFNYAQCSEMCNMEVQKFRGVAPMSLSLKEMDDGIFLTWSFVNDKKPFQVKFVDVGKNEHKVLRIRDNPQQSQQQPKLTEIHPGSAYQSAFKFLTEIYTHATIRQTKNITINMKKWPKKFLKLPNVSNIPDWKIAIYKSMHDDFMVYMDRKSEEIRELMFYHCEDEQLPLKFYKSKFFRDLKNVQFLNPSTTKMDEDDFIMSKSCTQNVDSAIISDKAFNRKLRQWYDGRSKETCDYKMGPTIDNGREIDIHVIIDKLPFAKFGESYKILRGDGVVGRIEFDTCEVYFKVVQSLN